MTLTLFKCETCGCRMALSGDDCNHCHKPKPDVQKWHGLGILALGTLVTVGLAAF